MSLPRFGDGTKIAAHHQFSKGPILAALSSKSPSDRGNEPKQGKKQNESLIQEYAIAEAPESAVL